MQNDLHLWSIAFVDDLTYVAAGLRLSNMSHNGQQYTLYQQRSAANTSLWLLGDDVVISKPTCCSYPEMNDVRFFWSGSFPRPLA